MKFTKNIPVLLITLCVCAAELFAAPKTVNVIKENTVLSPAKFMLIHGMGYLSSDDMAGIYDAEINWQTVSKKVILKIKGKKIEFKVNSKKVIVNGTEVLMKKPAVYSDKNVYIPLEFVLTRLFTDISGYFTEWDYKRMLLRITLVPDLFPPRYYSYKDKTRIVIQATEKKEIQANSTTAKQITAKFYKSKTDLEKSSVIINDGVVDSIDGTNIDRDTFFLINLGTYAGNYDIFELSSPYRFVIDIARTGTIGMEFPGFSAGLAPSVSGFIESVIPVSIPLPEIERRTGQEASEQTEYQPERSNHKIKKIVVDAGHGGEDAGAVGPKGTKEKNINLEVSERLAKILRSKGYEVFMSRTDDSFIPLADRTKFANRVMADLFVSIHCNASINTKAQGFEIYFLSENASDKAAAAVANMENSVIALEKPKANGKEEIEYLLLTMAVCEFMNESSKLCGLICQDINSDMSYLLDRGVKQANFFVLRGATMPAVLVEMAYLSNFKEEKMLKTKKFQKRIAETILKGIQNYEKRFTK